MSSIYLTRIVFLRGKIPDQKLKNLIIKCAGIAATGSLISLNAMLINWKEKVLDKTDIYGQQFENLAMSITPQDLIHL